MVCHVYLHLVHEIKVFEGFSRVFCAVVILKFGAALEETVLRCAARACTVPRAGMLSKGPTDLTTESVGRRLRGVVPCTPATPQ